MQTVSRRDFLKVAGGAAVGLITVGGLSGAIMSCSKPAQNAEQAGPTALPWPYQKLDPTAVAERAYTAYYNGGCMYGAFEGIIGELRETVGSPYDTFPSELTMYGSAGVNGWGTLCGCLNGAAAAITMVLAKPDSGNVINEVFGWYGSEQLPDYKPETPKYSDIVASVSDSPLCHVSVTTWCKTSGFKTTDPQRAERCAWLTASTAKYTVEMLNKQADGTFALIHAVPASVASCLTCHGKGGSVGNVHIFDQNDCTGCHINLDTTHPIPLN